MVVHLVRHLKRTVCYPLGGGATRSQLEVADDGAERRRRIRIAEVVEADAEVQRDPRYGLPLILHEHAKGRAGNAEAEKRLCCIKWLKPSLLMVR